MPETLLDQVLPYLPKITAKLKAVFYFPRGVEASDVVHDVALRFQSRPPIDCPKLNERLWRLLHCACFNRARDHWRSWTRYEPRHREHQEKFDASKERTPLSQLVSSEAREEILSRLTAEQAQAVKLVEEGYSFEEIARKLAIGESAVRMRLHAARKRVPPVAA